MAKNYIITSWVGTRYAHPETGSMTITKGYATSMKIMEAKS